MCVLLLQDLLQSCSRGGRIITAVPVCVFIALVNAGSVCLLLGECGGECGEEKYYMSDVSDRIRVDPDSEDVQMVYGKKRTL